MRIPLAREGYPLILPAAGLGALALFIDWVAVAALLAAVTAFLVNFFRDPERSPPGDPRAIVSPADGKIIAIIDVSAEDSPLGHAARRTSVFMNPFNVHVNRAPADGVIREVRYRAGRKLAAFDERAPRENEQNLVVVETPRGKLAFNQIAGFLARRIVFYKSAGSSVVRGERVGIIKFGSRVDVFLPLEAELQVRLGNTVKAGTSVFALWPDGDRHDSHGH